MSIFGNIMSAIFGGSSKPQTIEALQAESVASPPTAASSAPPSSGAWQRVDVDAVVSGLAAQKKERLDWRTSIVDLMKVLDLDSSLAARKELARELGYAGDTRDTAAMNIWLHKQVMTKLAEHGGKVPEQLRT
jgi:Domain of unknown function (DUF3597)